ncbi:ABC transporter permease [Clostridium sp. AWRP]|uniref:ABC transporter permease n=1 Tax=Clostridium sp. AWRP TaxID=2212991 RepID=UPI000FDBEC9C|nr:ABC transporter permease [Clostridium sp. AWRP]AZV55647.1 ABC transporter permease [Clostridium sp. AWRP]
MRMLSFFTRTAKEILRDPLNVALGIGFPLVVLLLLSEIQANIPISLFKIDKLVPGISVFGLSFMTLFSSMLIAKDRSSALIQRLYTTPLTASDYILGYALPLIPISLAQSVICYITAIFLGLKITINIVYAILFSIPIALFFITLGLLFGSIFNDKQVGGICGPILTNLAAWLSGTWFDLGLVGGLFKKIAYALPFVHAVELGRAVLGGNFEGIFPHIWWVFGYAGLTVVISILVFTRKMKIN